MATLANVLTPLDTAMLQALAERDPATLVHSVGVLSNLSDLLAPFQAEVAAARQRLDQSTSHTAYNLALANYAEA